MGIAFEVILVVGLLGLFGEHASANYYYDSVYGNNKQQNDVPYQDNYKYGVVPNQAYYSAVPHQGYYGAVPNQGYYGAVPNQGYYGAVPKKGYYGVVPNQAVPAKYYGVVPEKYYGVGPVKHYGGVPVKNNYNNGHYYASYKRQQDAQTPPSVLRWTYCHFKICNFATEPPTRPPPQMGMGMGMGMDK